MWGATVYLPPNTAFQYKFIRVETDGSVRFFPCARSSVFYNADMSHFRLQIVWESDPNRQDTTPASGVQLIATSWR